MENNFAEQLKKRLQEGFPHLLSNWDMETRKTFVIIIIRVVKRDFPRFYQQLALVEPVVRRNIFLDLILFCFPLFATVELTDQNHAHQEEVGVAIGRYLHRLLMNSAIRSYRIKV